MLLSNISTDVGVAASLYRATTNLSVHCLEEALSGIAAASSEPASKNIQQQVIIEEYVLSCSKRRPQLA